MEEQTTNDNWIDGELNEFKTPTDYEQLPPLKLTPNVVTEITIDFSKPFEKWDGESNGKPITKKIIPVVVNVVKMHWWLNVKNPIYKEVLLVGKNNQTTIKIMQTGTKQDTKYILVK